MTDTFEKATFEDELEKNGLLVYSTVGRSMLPLIRQHRDVSVISKRPAGRLKKNDVVLYHIGERYVLHRIIGVTETGYKILGDNLTEIEYNVTDDEIIGVLTGLIRNGKKVNLAGLRYKMYVFFRCDLYFLRVPVLKIVRWGRRLAKKILVRAGIIKG